MEIRAHTSSVPGSLPARAEIGATAAAPDPRPAPVPAGRSADSLAAIGESIEQINRELKKVAPGVEFTVDSDTDTAVVKVVDRNTKEVLLQLPTEETLEIAKALDRLQGLLIRQRA